MMTSRMTTHNDDDSLVAQHTTTASRHNTGGAGQTMAGVGKQGARDTSLCIIDDDETCRNLEQLELKGK